MIQLQPVAPADKEDPVQEWNYTDPSTWRLFEVRLRFGPTDFEVLAKKTVYVPRYMVAEFRPNGRLIENAVEGGCLDVPEKKWKGAKEKPSTAQAALKAVMDENPGFHPVRWGGGYGSRTIFYDSLEECIQQIQNALDGDYWLCSDESIRRFVLADRTQITFEAKSLLDKARGEEQIYALIAEISSMLAKNEEAEIGVHVDNLRVEVTDPSKKYPDSYRMLLFVELDGRIPSGLGFVRGTWGELGDRVAGRRLPRYDGPEGLASGFPKFGQSFAAPETKPEKIGRVEVLHKQEGTTNKIYVYAEVGGTSFHAWGPYHAGKLSTKKAAQGGYDQMSKKRASGYERISPEEVPGFWVRLMEAFTRMK